ncbi:hypothetical protein BVRB_6g143390 [Beta vulgaris subsp. vulgaris]|nr:hypothetical protein BVRB_6g143390 [Beta vulgaris subsp. vulgaris]
MRSLSRSVIELLGMTMGMSNLTVLLLVSSLLPKRSLLRC